MAEQSKQPQNPPAGKEHPEVFSISQDKDGAFHLSRRGLVLFSAAIGGTVLLRGVCPRFAAGAAPGEAAQSALRPLPSVSIHTGPTIASNIAGSLQNDDIVRLMSENLDLGWVEVSTQSGQHGWVKRGSLDFTRAIRSSSPNFDLSSTPTPTPAQPDPAPTFSAQLRDGDHGPPKKVEAGQAQSCGEFIQNGDFEAGNVSWVQESTGTIIRDDWPDPHQGDWVAWLGGLDAVETLTQLFRVPADVLDAQKLEFYQKVTSEEATIEVNDTLHLRFLDAGGSPLCPDLALADNTTKMDWSYRSIDLDGMTELADQDMQIQFKAEVNATHSTSFVIDSVSLEMICKDPPVYYVYLPVVVTQPTPTPTSTPEATPCPSHNPCPSHCTSDCGSDCGSHCGSDCGSDCYSDCSSQCPSDCVFDCLHCSCIGHWCSYN